MLGIAQKEFLKKLDRPIVKPPFFFLEELVNANFLEHYDLILSQEILKNHPNDLASAALICHLSLAMRHGHTSVTIEEAIVPSIKTLWRSPKEQLSARLEEQLEGLIRQGAKSLPKEITSIVRDANRFYFLRFWRCENQIKDEIERILSNPPKLAIDVASIEGLIDKTLLPEQRNAILAACQNSLLLLSGGPGTGKTFTAAQFIKYLWEVLDEVDKTDFKIVLTAPTGKAASNLQQSLSRSINLPHIEAKTVHSLLGIKPGNLQQSEELTLRADLLIIDESSMIDSELFALLLKAIPAGTRTVFLGDPYQLPPIGAGRPFQELLSFLQKNHPQNVVELKTCLRAELQPLIQLAEAINRSDEEKLFEIASSAASAIQFSEYGSSIKTEKAILQFVEPLFKYNAEDPHHFLKEFKILTPLRKGILGVESLNQRIRQFFMTRSMGRALASPIIITKNHAPFQLFNGDTGVLICHDPHKGIQYGDYALFGEKKIAASLLPQFEYAYALSVHKSQGSEFNHVLLLFPEGSAQFGKQILYTAVTRAKKQLTIWGNQEEIKKGLN